MTNTKFRKRALLSSVAMLLVALVALGSATFAWFTSLPTANAQGLTMKATAAQGLVVLSSSAISNASKAKANAADWTHDEFLNCNSSRTASNTAAVSIDAASCAQDAAGTFYTTNASADNEATAKADAAVSVATGMYHEELWTKITGTIDPEALPSIKMTGLTITKAGSSDHALLPSFRVAIYYTNAAGTKSFVGEYGVAAHNNETHITAVATPGTTTYSAATKANKNVSAAPSSDVALSTCDGSGNCKLDIYCYLDGEDSTCFTNNVNANDVISKIKVDLAIA